MVRPPLGGLFAGQESIIQSKELEMPVISLFYGIVVSMYLLDNKQHKAPHIHVRYQDDEAV